MGFELNEYDKCVANKVINGEQCTIVFYVDDNKISHKDPKVLDGIIDKLSEILGKVTVSRGKKHDFLGMDITFNDDKTVSLSMKTQISESIEWFGEHVLDKCSTPATKHLFLVNDDSRKLDEPRPDIFHLVVAKALYISKRARPDIEPTVVFLCTRLSSPDEDDWKKLKRILGYLNGTIDDIQILGATGLDCLTTCVEAAYVVHNNMRSHTEGAMSMVRGLVHGCLSKQKLNTKSSTEAELVGVSKNLPYNIWLVNFFKNKDTLSTKMN